MATTYLSRTPSSTTNRKTFTISAWVKRANISVSDKAIFSGGSDADVSGFYTIKFDDNDKLRVQYYDDATYNIRTNRVFRDVSAWYHIVVANDTTQGTASNRTKIYINGVQETDVVNASGSTADYPNINFDYNVNNDSVQQVGANRNSSASVVNYFDGEMAHFHLTDGTAYDASAFGETDATTGIWKPKTAPSVTYGTNGFFLKFENSGAFGTDSSGNSNTFTVNGTMTQTIDTPSNVFATWNGVMDFASSGTFSNGNTQWNSGAATNRFWCTSSIGVSTGKWYVEMKNTVQAGHNLIGIAPRSAPALDWYLGGSGLVANADDDYQWGYKAENGNIVNNTNSTSYGNTYGTTDIIGIALDLDNNKLYFSKNGTWQNSGDPTSGATGTGAVSITSASSNPTGVYHIVGANATSGDSSTFQANFGNGYFGTTAVSSAQNPDDGIGIFEYDVPTGYYALNTKAINAQEYD